VNQGPAAAADGEQTVNQGPAAAAGGGSASGSNSSENRALLTRQVQLLVSEYVARQRLKQLQAKQAAVQGRRDQLLAAAAQLEARQLRRWVCRQ
jgi:hypothetical protein